MGLSSKKPILFFKNVSFYPSDYMTSEMLSFTSKRNSICFKFFSSDEHPIGNFSYSPCNGSVSSFTSHILPEFTKPEYSCKSVAQSYIRGKSLKRVAPVIQHIKAISALLNEIVLEHTPQYCLIYIYSLVLNFINLGFPPRKSPFPLKGGKPHHSVHCCI